MNLQRDAARLASIATIFVWVGWLFVAVRPDRRDPVVDRPGRPDGVQLPRGLRDLGGGHRHATLPGPDRGRPRSRSPALRPVRGQQVPVTRWRGEIHMFIRRLARRVAALGGVMLLVAACSTATAAAPEDAGRTGRGDPGDVLGPSLVCRRWRPDDRPERPLRRRRLQGAAGHRVRRLQRVRRRLSDGRTAAPGEHGEDHTGGMRRGRDRVRKQLPDTPRPGPLLQRPRQHAHHPSGRWRGRPALRRGAEQPAPRAVGRRLLRVGSRRPHGPDRGNRADRRLPPGDGGRLVRVQHL